MPTIRRKCFAIALAFVASPLAAAPKKPVPVGLIQHVTGTPEILRNPVKKSTGAWEKSAQQRGFPIAYHLDQFWEAHPMRIGQKLYYGDQVSTLSGQNVTIQLNDGIKLSVAANTVIKISRAEIKAQNQSLVENWISLLAGTIRAASQKKNESNLTNFRTQSIAMGIRGTDFVMERTGKESRVITIEGKVSVRKVSDAEHQAFEELTSPPSDSKVSLQKREKLSQQIANLAKLEPEVFVDSGMKLAVGPNEVSDRVSTGLALTGPVLQLKPTPIDATDLQPVMQMSQEFGKQQTAEENRNLERLVAKTQAISKLPTTSPEGPEKPTIDSSADTVVWSERHVAIASLSSVGISLVSANGHKIEIGGITYGLDYRWSPLKYFDLGVFYAFAANFDHRSSDDPATQAAKVDDPVHLLGGRMGGKYGFGRFGLGIGMAFLRMNNLVIEFEQQGSKIRQEFLVSPTPMITAFAQYRFSDRWSGYVEFGGNGLKLRPTNTEPSQVHLTEEHGFGQLRLGAGYWF